MTRLARIVLIFLAAALASTVHGAEPREAAALRQKAEQGNSLAQYNLGLIYAEGRIVPKDLPEAFAWLTIASEGGSTGNALESVLGVLTDAQLADGRGRVARYRALVAARTPVVKAALPKPTNRGFTVTGSEVATDTPTAATDAPTPKTPAEPTVSREPLRPDEPMPDELTTVRIENSRLKAELLRAKQTIQDQAATIARLRQSSGRGNFALPPRALEPDKATSPAGGP